MSIAAALAVIVHESSPADDFSTLDKWRAPGAQRCAVVGCSDQKSRPSEDASDSRQWREYRDWQRWHAQVEQVNQQMQQAFTRKDWVAAEASARQMVALLPGPNAYSNLGTALLGQGRLDEAQQAFEDSRVASLSKPEWHTEIWRQGLEQLHYERAQLLETDEKMPDDRRRHNMAHEYLEAIRSNPGSADRGFYWTRLALGLTGGSDLRQGDFADRRVLEIAGAHALTQEARDQVDSIMSREMVTQMDEVKSQVQSLMTEVDHIVVPSPIQTRHVQEGVILGGMADQEQVRRTATTTRSPFTGRPWKEDEVFGFADSTSVGQELHRLISDSRFQARYSLNTPTGKRLVERLNGTHFSRLVAHSNGATIAEALIRADHIKVDELNVLGGDRSLANLLGYRELVASGKVQRVVIWINPGDPIPVASSWCFPIIRDDLLQVEPAARWVARKWAGEQLYFSPGSVEYRVLSGSKFEGQDFPARGENFWAAHDLTTYVRNIQAYFR